jgi:hypothetical protein
MHLIFTEVLTMVYSLLLQMICSIKASAKLVSILRVKKTRSLGRDHLLCTFLMLLWVVDHQDWQ